MKRLILPLLLLVCFQASSQYTELPPAFTKGIDLRRSVPPPSREEDIRLASKNWRLNRNKLYSGGLVFLAGLSKGFNETLQFHWKTFRKKFPHANPQWFNPDVSWRNKYRNGDPNQGPKSFLSTSVLVGFTDQYHLNNMVNRLSWTGAMLINLGGGKKPFRQYLFDMVYFTACHYAGFATTYYPFSRHGNK